MNYDNIPGSFRDPSGFLFSVNGRLYRQVNSFYQENYEHLMQSGLYEGLVSSGLLVPHKEVDIKPASGDAYKIIQPEPLPLVSYPYEWSFSQLRDAALTLLAIQKKAFDFGMSLKDSSAYNIQFLRGKPLLIDTLSLEKNQEGLPWIAYRQFCQHFLAPLVLMSYKDYRLNQLARIYLDGIPLDLDSTLLPWRTKLRPALFTHIHLHAKSQQYFAGKQISTRAHRTGRRAFQGLIDNLESTVNSLRWRIKETEWADYNEDKSYSSRAFAHKKEVVSNFLSIINPHCVLDIGANKGLFSRLASDRNIFTISLDSDPMAVEINYRDCVARGETHIYPICVDMTNPSPGIGWENEERSSFFKRNPADTTIALALVHHLAISNNLPLPKIAGFFKRMCRWLIIEFVPKSDCQVQRLLSTRKDIFPNYNQQTFEEEFDRYFIIQVATKIVDSKRTLYLMEKR